MTPRLLKKPKPLLPPISPKVSCKVLCNASQEASHKEHRPKRKRETLSGGKDWGLVYHR